MTLARMPLVLWGSNVLLSCVEIVQTRASVSWLACWLVILIVNVFLVGKYSGQWNA